MLRIKSNFKFQEFYLSIAMFLSVQLRIWALVEGRVGASDAQRTGVSCQTARGTRGSLSSDTKHPQLVIDEIQFRREKGVKCK